jgi:hypothetical protein
MSANVINQQNKDELGGEDVTPPIFKFFDFGSVVVKGTITAIGYTYESDTFIIDHPVMGDIDSATLKIDGTFSDKQVTYFNYNIKDNSNE